MSKLSESNGSAAERLWQLWRQGKRPNLESYVASIGPIGLTSLAAVLRVDQAESWATSSPVPVEEYLRRFPAVASDPVAAVDLIHNEYILAERAGQRVDDESFIRRFPEHADTIRLQIDFHRAMMPVTYSAIQKPSPSHQSTISRVEATGTVPPGSTFGEYELLALIARGGMGVVYKARQPKLDRIVALKMILSGHFASEEAIVRFRSEAQAVARLDHPGIVPVFEIGELRGLNYFTMAFIEGQSLADQLRNGPINPTDAARLIRELCSAVAYAHDQGIVHRDLKPANVLIDRQGNSKLTDFGLAKRTYEAEAMTGTGEVLGTPAYMSPEQALGGGSEIGSFTDIYGLGALLYALLTGRPPFQAATPLETMQQVCDAQPVRPRSLNPSIPRDLETICRKCLEKSPTKRYASATALADDLDRFLHGRPIQARPVSLLEKLLRWYIRRPVIGTMGLALLAAFFAFPLMLALLWDAAESRALSESMGRATETAARLKVEAAERQRTHDLFDSFVKEAGSRRSSPKLGRRFQALESIVEARKLAEELSLPAKDYARLRSEAIGALSQVDIHLSSDGSGWHPLASPRSGRYLENTDYYLAWEAPNSLLVCRAKSDEVIHRIPVGAIEDTQNEARLSNDNRFLFSLERRALRVWQIDGDQPKLLLNRERIEKAWFSPDRAEIVLASMLEGIVIMDLPNGKPIKTINLAPILPGAIQIRLGSLGPRHQLALVRAQEIFIVSLDQEKLTATIASPYFPDEIQWTPDGETLAISNRDQGVSFYRLRSKTKQVVKAPLGGPVQVAFDPSSRFALFTNGWTSRDLLVDVERATPILPFHTSELFVTGSNEIPRLGRLEVTRDTIHRSISLSPSDGLATFESLAVHPEGRLLATPTSTGIIFTDLRLGTRLGFVATGGLTRGIRFDTAGNLFAIRQEGRALSRVAVWQVKLVGNEYTVGAPKSLGAENVGGMDVSKNGRFAATGLFTGSQVLDRQTGRGSAVWPFFDTRQVAIHPDGSLVAAFSFGGRGFEVREVATGKLRFAHPSGGEGRGRFTPNGERLITYGVGETDMLAWSVPDFKEAQKLGPIGMFAISPDSRYLAVSEANGKIRINRFLDGNVIARFDAPGEDYLQDLAYSADGHYLLGMNTDRTRHHVWDIWQLRQQLRELKLDWETDPPPTTDSIEPITVKIVPQTWWGPIVGPLPMGR